MIFVTIDNFQRKNLNFNQISVIGAIDDIYEPSDIAILKINGVNYCCIISGISKNKAINLIQNADLTLKSGTLQNIKMYYHIKNE